MKKILTLAVVLSLLIVNPINSTSETHDNKSTIILNKLSKTYKSYKSIQAKFTISIKNKQTNTAVKQTGTLYQKGKKFRVDMSGQEIYCDGKTLWTYLKDANEVQITKFNAKTSEINPASIFTIYEKGFIHKHNGQVTANGQTLDVIELAPIDKNKSYYKVKLAVDKLANKIKEMSVYSKSGLISTYIITKFTPNVQMNDNFFKFDEKDKPGVIVINLKD